MGEREIDRVEQMRKFIAEINAKYSDMRAMPREAMSLNTVKSSRPYEKAFELLDKKKIPNRCS